MSATDPIRLSPGDVVDDFEILDVIATGGSSTTFRAMNRALAREVSLKFVHPVMFSDDKRAIEAARAEAIRVARLEHPGIAPVYEAGFYEGGLYIASAMPQGRTLAELGSERAITPVQTAGLVAEVAEALQAAHALGVVHRDLRPECVTVDRWGHGVVRDFGVTRTSGRTGLLTRAEALQSLRYTAPELILGLAATPAADVYELAAVAVWCLTGEPPYHDRPAAEYVVFRASAPPPALTQGDGAPATTLNTVLKAAMALDPAERPSPAEFASALSYAVSRLAPGVGDAGCPLRASEVEPAALPAIELPAPAGGGDATRIEPRRPLPAAPVVAAPPAPWGTYAACATIAVLVGLGGLFAGRAATPQGPAPIRVGAVTVDAGDTWKRGAASGASKLAGAHLTGGPGETATVGVIQAARLPGDPVPAGVLADARARPRAATSAGVALVSYAGSRSRVLARPTSTGTLAAVCSPAVALGRCAALVARARGLGRGLALTPSPPVIAALRKSMAAIERGTRVGSAELGGSRIQQSGAAGRLASTMRDAAADLEVAGVDPGTAAQLEQVRAAVTDEAGALDDLGGAIDRLSDVAFDAATDLIRASRGRLTAALAAFKRAGYPVRG